MRHASQIVLYCSMLAVRCEICGKKSNMAGTKVKNKGNGLTWWETVGRTTCPCGWLLKDPSDMRFETEGRKCNPAPEGTLAVFFGRPRP